MTKPRIVNKMPQFTRQVQEKGAKGMVQALSLGASHAAMYTPRADSNLINSQFRDVKKEGSKVVGTVGYTAEYALAVHEAKGSLMGKGVPRPLGPGGQSRGNVWDPGAEPEFLRKGFDEAAPLIEGVLTGAIKT